MTATTTRVKEIYTTAQTTTQLEPFLAVAQSFLAELFVESGYTTDRQDLLTIYLTAHLAAIDSPRAYQKSVGRGSSSFKQELGLGLDQTVYGQQFRMLDTKKLIPDSRSIQPVFEFLGADSPLTE